MSINKMRCALGAILLMAFALGGFMATAATADEIKAIKRDGRYIYGEATNIDEVMAQQEAEYCLLQYVNDFLWNEGIEKGLAPSDLKGVNFLSMEKKNGIRVMAYVEKDVVLGKAPASATTNRTLVEERTNREAEKVNKQITSELPRVIEEPAPVAEAPAQPESQPKTLPMPARRKSAPNVDWTKAAVYEVIGNTHINDAWETLDALKVQGKVRRFGAEKDVRNPDESYWVVCDKQGIVLTALGPVDESGRRYDFVTGEYHTLRDYPDSLLFWFELRIFKN